VWSSLTEYVHEKDRYPGQYRPEALTKSVPMKKKEFDPRIEQELSSATTLREISDLMVALTSLVHKMDGQDLIRITFAIVWQYHMEKRIDLLMETFGEENVYKAFRISSKLTYHDPEDLLWFYSFVSKALPYLWI
jgi:hypothetical protein